MKNRKLYETIMSRINPAITKLLNEAEEMTPNKQQIIDEAIAFFED